MVYSYSIYKTITVSGLERFHYRGDELNSRLLRISSKQGTVQYRHPILRSNAFGGDAFRIVAHEHVREMFAVVDPFPLPTIFWQRSRDGGEIRLVEVRKGEPLASVQADLMRRRREKVVCHILHHIPYVNRQIHIYNPFFFITYLGTL
jgi:hypothetical protein